MSQVTTLWVCNIKHLHFPHLPLNFYLCHPSKWGGGAYRGGGAKEGEYGTYYTTDDALSLEYRGVKYHLCILQGVIWGKLATVIKRNKPMKDASDISSSLICLGISCGF